MTLFLGMRVASICVQQMTRCTPGRTWGVLLLSGLSPLVATKLWCDGAFRDSAAAPRAHLFVVARAGGDEKIWRRFEGNTLPPSILHAFLLYAFVCTLFCTLFLPISLSLNIKPETFFLNCFKLLTLTRREKFTHVTRHFFTSDCEILNKKRGRISQVRERKLFFPRIPDLFHQEHATTPRLYVCRGLPPLPIPVHCIIGDHRKITRMLRAIGELFWCKFKSF